MNHTLDRVKLLLDAMHVDAGEAVLLHKPSNMFYISGYTGEGLVLLSTCVKAIVTDFRYTEQASKQAPGFSVYMTTRECDHNQTALKILKEQGVNKVYYEDDHITVRDFRDMEQVMAGMSFVPVNKAPEKMREIKDASEIEKMARACKITSEAFDYILGVIKEGMTGDLSRSYRGLKRRSKKRSSVRKNGWRRRQAAMTRRRRSRPRRSR